MKQLILHEQISLVAQMISACFEVWLESSVMIAAFWVYTVYIKTNDSKWHKYCGYISTPLIFVISDAALRNFINTQNKPIG